MILNDKSVLRNLPHLAPNDLYIFDSIRFSIEIIDYQYKSLFKELLLVSNKQGGDPAAYFGHVWSIVENTHRFYSLLNKKVDLQGNLLFIDKVKHFRHTYAHLDERINEGLTTKGLPIFGVIYWNYNIESKRHAIPYIAISGIVSKGKDSISKINQSFIIKDYCGVDNYISDVELRTFVKNKRFQDKLYSTFSLSENLSNLKDLVQKTEKALESSMRQNNKSSIDWSKNRDIVIIFNEMD